MLVVLSRKQSQASCLRKIRSFGVSASLLAVFYNAAVCNALTFDVVCWGGNISKHEWGRLDKIAKKREPRCGS